jgi:DNA-binding response OmpR family regulator
MAMAADPARRRAGPRPTILVVEDDPGIRTALVGGLELSGYRVVAASDGWEALEQLDESLPALIILDLQMPRMDGVTFAREFGRRGLRPSIPLLLLSGDSDARARAGQIGAEWCLSKPLRFPVLLEAVDALVAERRASAQVDQAL